MKTTNSTITPTQQKIRKKTFISLILSSAIFMGLLSLVLTPLNVFVSNDGVYMDGPLPDITYLTIMIFEILTFAFCFSALILSIAFLSLKGTRRLIFTYLFALCLREVIDLIFTAFTYNGIGDVDVFSSVSHVILGGILMLTVVLIANGRLKSFKAKRNIQLKDGSDTTGVFPIESVFDKKNPILLTTGIMALILCLFNIIQRIILILTELSLTLSPSFNVLAIMGSFVFDIFLALVYYAASWFFMDHFYRKHLC
ncbi:MAG: hypothetical protein J6Q78_03940 [Clostridia bacterium]|nr:hypothetical protein [Clostridia bacterium]